MELALNLHFDLAIHIQFLVNETVMCKKQERHYIDLDNGNIYFQVQNTKSGSMILFLIPAGDRKFTCCHFPLHFPKYEAEFLPMSCSCSPSVQLKYSSELHQASWGTGFNQTEWNETTASHWIILCHHVHWSPRPLSAAWHKQ